MTADDLVAQFVSALQDHSISLAETVDAFDKFSPKIVHSTEDVTVWSLALNYETRDVRFVKMDGGSGFIGETFPVTVMHTEYQEG